MRFESISQQNPSSYQALYSLDLLLKQGPSAGAGAPDNTGGWRCPTEEPLPGIWPELRPNFPAGGSSVLTLVTGTATARGLLKLSPAMAMDVPTVMAMGMATTVEEVHVHAHVTGSATVRGLPSPSPALELSTSPTPK